MGRHTAVQVRQFQSGTLFPSYVFSLDVLMIMPVFSYRFCFLCLLCFSIFFKKAFNQIRFF